jgi:hypothetical protein
MIICDDDVVRSLLKSRFITLEAHREKNNKMRY